MTHKEASNNSPLAPLNQAPATIEVAPIPASRANKALLFSAIATIYQIFPPIRKGYAHVVR